MIDNPQHSFRTTKLDPALLSTPFGVQTNWHVITGAPCSGKTTLIDLLTDKGFLTVPEMARQYFEKELARGRTLDEILENEAALQRCIDEMQMELSRDYGRLKSPILTELYQIPSPFAESLG
jgi:hypothetical protein